jgi:two-component system, NarL family, nitrate/nitrite response regulator NarL
MCIKLNLISINMRVLLADDSELILERLQDMLSKYKQVEIVGTIKNGTETLEALRILKPDMAIVDVRMPGLSGREVLNKIRQEDKTVKFIILTFSSSDYYRQAAMQAGADYFFSKVDDFDKLSRVVEEMALKEKKYKN